MWYYSDGSEQKGPVSIQGIKSLYETRAINADTLVWSHGMASWEKLMDSPLADAIEIDLPTGDTWQTCAYSGERGRLSDMVPLDGFSVLARYKDAAVDFIQQGGVLPKAGITERPAGNIDFAHLLTSTWRLASKDLLLLMGLYLLYWIPGNAFCNAFEYYVYTEEEDVFRSARMYNFVNLVLGNMFLGAAYHVAWRRVSAQSTTFGSAVLAGFSNWGRLFVVHFVAGIKFLLGLLLLLVPGLIVIARTFHGDALAVERGIRGTVALDESWDISRGYVLRTLFYLSILGTLTAIPIFGFEIALGFLPQFDHWILRSIVGTVLELPAVLWIAFNVCYTRELRERARSSTR